MKRSIATIRKDMKPLQEQLLRLTEELHEAKARTKVPCYYCGRKTVVAALTYIQTYWYDHNTGSPNGGYFRPGEVQFECPKCGRMNRPINNTFDFKSLKRYFKEAKDVYPNGY